MNDPLTIAYIAIGAARELDATTDQRAFDALIERSSGELGFIGECIAHAPMLDALPDENYGGVFAYDVAEEFGATLARRALAGINTDEGEARTIAHNLHRADMLGG